MRNKVVKKLRRVLIERIKNGESFSEGMIFKQRFNEYKNALRTLKREWHEGLWK